MVEFRYPPIIVGATVSDQQAFANHFPDHMTWLTEHGIAFRINGYRWPEMLTHYLHRQVGTAICELAVEITSDYADAYAAFIGFTSDERG